MTAGDFKNGANLDAFIASGQIGSTTATTIYTVAAGQRIKVATFSLCNTGSGAVAVSVSVVPSGGSVDGTHLALSFYQIAANDTISQDDVLAALKGATLPAGAFISVTASQGGAIDYVLTGAVSS